MQNSESVTISITSINEKNGYSEKSKKDYDLLILSGKTTSNSGFKSTLPVEFPHFVNKGQDRPNFKIGQEVTIGIDSLEITKWSIKIKKGSIL